MPDKYRALWLSHSSIRDFHRCPRAYFLANIYRNPQTGNKIQIVTPALSIGSAVHEVLEAISSLPSKERFQRSLVERLIEIWPRFQGEIGGFTSERSEREAQERARAMLVTVMDKPGPLAKAAIKIKSELPQYWFSENEEMILCGKLDWMEYIEESDSVHIIDFKTGKGREQNSLQLPIYALLASKVQPRPVGKISYWYLALASQPEEQPLPELTEAEAQIMTVAKQIKLARQLGVFKCPQGESGCPTCRPLERIARGEGKLVQSQPRQRDNFLLADEDLKEEAELIE